MNAAMADVFGRDSDSPERAAPRGDDDPMTPPRARKLWQERDEGVETARMKRAKVEATVNMISTVIDHVDERTWDDAKPIIDELADLQFLDDECDEDILSYMTEEVKEKAEWDAMQLAFDKFNKHHVFDVFDKDCPKGPDAVILNMRWVRPSSPALLRLPYYACFQRRRAAHM